MQIYGTGQGEISPAVEEGTTAPGLPLAVTPGLPEVSIGGRRALVRFSGLAPGFVGVWQVNATVPADAPAGAAVPLILTYGLAGRAFSVAIQ